eukprot:1907244-Pyramimonas_sp.AAC.1
MELLVMIARVEVPVQQPGQYTSTAPVETHAYAPGSAGSDDEPDECKQCDADNSKTEIFIKKQW